MLPLDARQKYQMILEEKTFSFQNRRFGPLYVIKLIGIFSMIIVLTWYGKRSGIDRVKVEQSIYLVSDSNNLSMYLFPALHSSLPIISIVLSGEGIAIPEFKSQSAHHSWNYLALTASPKIDSSPPPLHFWIADTAHLVKAPNSWPAPTFIRDDILSNNPVKTIRPFNDDRRALLLNYSSCTILFIDGKKSVVNEQDSTLLHEKIDLLILQNIHSNAIGTSRKLFRPYYTIVYQQIDETKELKNNILYLSSTSYDKKKFILSNSGIVSLIPDEKISD